MDKTQPAQPEKTPMERMRELTRRIVAVPKSEIPKRGPMQQLQTLFGFLPVRGKAKSLTLLAGRVGTRTAPARYVIADEEQLVAWARANAPSLISTPPVKQRVLVKDLAAWLLPPRDGGGLPPGVQHVEAHEEFFADPA